MSGKSLVELLQEIDQAYAAASLWGDLTESSDYPEDVITGYPDHYIVNGDTSYCGCEEHAPLYADPTHDQLVVLRAQLVIGGLSPDTALKALILATEEFDRWGSMKPYTTCLQLVVNRKIRELQPEWTCFTGNWVAIVELIKERKKAPPPERF